MKLFNRVKEEEEVDELEEELEEASEESMEAPEGPDPSEELAAVLDASVKEISEKIARLSSTVETSQEARTGLEEKLLRMEDRMRKLSSLTEMISSQYNPFLGDGSADGEGVTAAPELPPPAFPTLETGVPPPPKGAAAPALAAEEAAELDDPLPDDSAFGDLEAADPALEPSGNEDFDFLEADDPLDAEATAEPDTDTHEGHGETSGDARLDRVRSNFENSLLMLKWADTLLRASRSRDGVVELLHYYESIGWIGEGVRTQLLAYTEGLSVPEGEAPADWRASADIHERSLLFIEKLRGCRNR